MRRDTEELSRWTRITAEDLVSEKDIHREDLHKKATALTRRRVLFAAMQCFAAKGYQQTTIREIAKLAGVTYGALYHHFEDKKALLLEANRVRVKKILEIISATFSLEEDFFTSLEWRFRQLFASVVSDPILFGIVREFNGLALTDPDFNKMHNEIDMEMCQHFLTELEKRRPHLSAEKRSYLAQMLNVILEGLLMLTLAKSPAIGPPETIVEPLFEALRLIAREWESEASPN